MAWKETVSTVEALRDRQVGMDIVPASMRGIETKEQSNGFFTETIFLKVKRPYFTSLACRHLTNKAETDGALQIPLPSLSNQCGSVFVV